jgi:Isochorismatase family
MVTQRALVATTVALLAALTLPVTLSVAPARAQTIIDEWDSVKVPPSPELKPVTADPKTTALLMLDFMYQNCGKRPRCVASIPAMEKLLDEARAAKVMVVYAIITGTTTADVIKEVAPTVDEPWIRSGADKFINTDLEKMLKDKGIQTVM